MKDRKKTEEQIISAVDDLVLEKGYSSLGINAISRKAGVSKVLIYRYFTDINGLLDSWAKKNSYWKSPSSIVDPQLKVKDQVKGIFLRYSNALNNDRIKREILRGIINQDTPLGQKIMKDNEEAGYELTKDFQKKSPNSNDFDGEALFAILTAGISYMALMKDRADLFNGININTEKGWNRIEDMVEVIIDTIIDK